MEIPEENQKCPEAVVLLNKIYGLVEVEICWFNKIRYDRTAIGFE